jgi:hypothetical protein
MTALSPEERDLLIRTVIGEADDQSPAGKVAVAHTALNRLADGSYGKTMPDVLFAKHQFEPWATRSRELMAIDPSSKNYRNTAKLVDDAVSGAQPDKTGGATHFLDPAVVMHRYGKLPSWAQGDGIPIGDHTFYRPTGPARTAANGPEASAVIHSRSMQAPADDLDERLKAYDRPGARTGAAVAPDDDLDARMQAYDRPATAAEPARPDLTRLPGGVLDRANAAIDATSYWPTMGEHFAASGNMFGSGIGDLTQGRFLPRFPSLDPNTWAGGGLLKTAGGVLGMGYSPVSAGIEKWVEAPVTAATRNELAGKAAGLAASFALPGPKFFPRANGAKILTHDVRGVGAPDILAAAPTLRAAEHPALSLMDVEPRAAGWAERLVSNPETSAASAYLTAVARRRAADAGKGSDFERGIVSHMNERLLSARGEAPPIVVRHRTPGDGSSMVNAAIIPEVANQLMEGGLGHWLTYAAMARAAAKSVSQRWQTGADQKAYLNIAKLISEPGGEGAIAAAQRASGWRSKLPTFLQHSWMPTNRSLFDLLKQPAAEYASQRARGPLYIRTHGADQWQ